MQDRAIGETEEEREAALPSTTAVGLAGPASWPSGPRRRGKGGQVGYGLWGSKGRGEGAGPHGEGEKKARAAGDGGSGPAGPERREGVE